MDAQGFTVFAGPRNHQVCGPDHRVIVPGTFGPSITLATGTRLDHYEILSHLGAGGMGEVYRARDTKLARDVAFKLLPEAFTEDPERLLRFQRPD